jgi:hypothetical protein
MGAIGLKSCLHRDGLTGEWPVIVCLSSCWRDVPDGFDQSVVVEPGHPFQRCQLEGLIGLAHFLGIFMAPPFQSFAPSPKPERFNRLKARGL